MAAGRTVDAERRVHSMHAYFLQLGDPKIPVVYDVDRIRDGGSFTTRRVVAIQHGQAIFNLAASFQVPEAGPEHYDRMPDGPVAGLAAGPRSAGRRTGPETIDRQGAPHVIDALDFRHVGDPWNPGPNRGAPVRDPDQDTWFRTRGRLPDDSAAARVRRSRTRPTSRCSAPRRCRIPLGPDDPGFMMASLDHVMWFHRPFRADEWLLYHVHSPSAGTARGLRDRADLLRRRHAGGERGPGRAAPADALGRDDAMPPVRASSTSAPTPSPRRRRRCGGRWPTPRWATTRTARIRPCAGSSRSRPALLGKEAALYVPSGTMANQLALRLLGRPGTEVLCGERAHVYRYEHAAAAGNARVQLRPLPDADGTLAPGDVDARGGVAAAPPARDLRAVRREHAHAGVRAAVARRRARRGRRGRARRRASRCTATARASGTRRSRSVLRRASSPPGPTPSCSACRRGLSAPVGSLLCGPRGVDRRGARANAPASAAACARPA